MTRIATTPLLLLACLCAALASWSCSADSPGAAPIPPVILPPPVIPPVTPPSPPQDTSPGWFVVSEITPKHRDSYLVYLDDAAKIAIANQLIAKTIPPMIVVAPIAKGSDGFNRNTVGDNRWWSWHVEGVVEFSDVSVEILDGWPSYVEGNVDGWIRNTKGMVGFWGYTITARYTLKGSG